MPDTIQHTSLVVGVLDLFHLDHLGLFQHLHGVETMIVFGLDEVNATEATGTESALQREILLRVLAPRSALLLGLLALALSLSVSLSLSLLSLRWCLLSIVCTLTGIGWGVYNIVDAGGIVGPPRLLVRRCL
jgi:hypothetical protein